MRADAAPPALPLWKFRSRDEWEAARDGLYRLHRPILRFEERVAGRLAAGAADGRVAGYSVAAGRSVPFEVARGPDGAPDWRETMRCPDTGLNARTRAAWHAWRTERPDGAGDRLYLPEAGTPLHRFLLARHPRVTGSLFGPGPHGHPREDLTRLSFADGSFDALLCLEVLEHVPDHPAAMRESARVLVPGGLAVFTVPFLPDAAETLTRASVGPDGAVVHREPPEYHGDPTRLDGILCLRHFGWSLLDELRRAGFADACAAFYASREFGYLGAMQVMFLATR